MIIMLNAIVSFKIFVGKILVGLLKDKELERMIHSTHFINLYMIKNYSDNERKEGNVLFNDTLNTFYLWLYGIRHDKEPFRLRERKPTASTWATPSD